MTNNRNDECGNDLNAEWILPAMTGMMNALWPECRKTNVSHINEHLLLLFESWLHVLLRSFVIPSSSPM